MTINILAVCGATTRRVCDDPHHRYWVYTLPYTGENASLLPLRNKRAVLWTVDERDADGLTLPPGTPTQLAAMKFLFPTTSTFSTTAAAASATTPHQPNSRVSAPPVWGVGNARDLLQKIPTLYQALCLASSSAPPLSEEEGEDPPPLVLPPLQSGAMGTLCLNAHFKGGTLVRIVMQ